MTFDPHNQVLDRTLTALRDEAYDNAKAHGFHDKDVRRTVGDAMMLIATEVSEAFEAFREGGKLNETLYDPGTWGSAVPLLRESKSPDGSKLYKPVGVPSELADIIIRVLDFCGEHDIDIERVTLEKMAYNRSRPYKHGNKVL
jgi:NTP pyrophosphatase (non-canonical NTP hydrolase)